MAEGSPKFLEQNPDKICQTCVDKLFKDLLARKLRREYLLEVGDINRNIELNDCVWSTIFFNPEYGEMGKSRAHTWEPTMEMQQATGT